MRCLSPKVSLLGLSALVLSALTPACADSNFATLELALYTEADYFTLDIHNQKGESLYATGCLLRQARTFRVSNLETADKATIVFHYYSDVSCEPSAHVGVGVRGGVEVVDGEERYYHIPVLADGDVTALPVDQNVSAGFATEVTYCEPDAECTEPGASGICKKAFDDGTQKFKYWCVPSCAEDSDCESLHPRAMCDDASQWCVLPSPYPLNISTPRAYGQATTAPNGDVVLIGGFTSENEGVLSARDSALEKYVATSGLFETFSIEGDEALKVGMAGMVELSRGGSAQVVLVGGAGEASLSDGAPGDFEEVSGDVVVLDLDDSSLTLHDDALDPVVAPGVASSGSALIVVGGWRAGDDGALAPSSVVTRCEADGADLACTQVGELATARTAPALLCLDDGCAELLVVGGNSEGPVSEVIDFTTSTTSPEFTTMASPGLPGAIVSPQLCGDRLVGGIEPSGESAMPLAMSVDASVGVLTATELENVDGIMTHADSAILVIDDECWVFGGRGASAGSASSALWRVGQDAVIGAGVGIALEQARYGALVAVVSEGELAGSVIIAGGLSSGSDEGESPRLLPGAEIFRP